MISKDKTYRTRAGSAVRIYATGQVNPFNVHGAVESSPGFWWPKTWDVGGVAVGLSGSADDNLIEADPNGILPRHRKLLAEVYKTAGYLNHAEVEGEPFNECDPWTKCALIALAKLDSERGKA